MNHTSTRGALLPCLSGGLLAGGVIVAGEAVLNLSVLADDWLIQFAQFGLRQPTPLVAIQGVLKLMLLGIATVWLSLALQPSFGNASRASIAGGLLVWFLVWAWVQWGMLLAGYVTPRIAFATVLWGLFELPAAAWCGVRFAETVSRPAAAQV